MLKNRTFFNRYIKPILVALYARESGVIARRRATVFIYSTTLLIGGVVLNLCGLAGPVAPFFQVANSMQGLFALLGRSMIRNIARLDKENTELKDEKQEILNVFHLTEQQMRSYMALARDKGIDPEQTAEILTAVGAVAEKRILDNVAHYVRQSTIEFDKLRERLPELTTSELEICALVLKEKKLKEIIALLGKSRGNITCQRTNIRSKLGLQPQDKLLEVLRKRVDGQ